MDNNQMKYLEYILIAMAFGIGQWMLKVKRNVLYKTVFDFTSELLFALLAGFVTVKMCESFEMKETMTCALISINSFMGSKFLNVMQYITTQYIAKKFGIDDLDLSTMEEPKKEETKQ